MMSSHSWDLPEFDFKYLDLERHDKTCKITLFGKYPTPQFLLSGLLCAFKLQTEDIVCLNRFEKPNEWYLEARTIELCNKLVHTSVISLDKDTRIVCSTVAPSVELVRVHWLPSYITSEFLKDTFNTIGDVKGVCRVLDPVTGIDNGVREVFLEGAEPDTIPYILRFKSINFRLLVTVRGRPPYCTKCGRVGHSRKHCVSVKPPPFTQSTASAKIIITDSETDTISDSATEDNNTVATPKD